MIIESKLSSRERVRLALAHETTDRIPIAMVCAGINPPAAAALDELLQRTRGIDLQSWLSTFIDIRGVGTALHRTAAAAGRGHLGRAARAGELRFGRLR